MMKIKLKKQLKIYIQDWGTYPNQTLVCSGVNYDSIISYCRKNKIKIDVSSKEKLLKQSFEINYGLAIVFRDNSSLLWVKDYKNNWFWVENLMHEIHHLVFMLSDNRNMSNEMEAQAYQFCYLFKQIRKRLEETKK